MANAKKTAPIRLSNKTAIGLRKTAQRVRGAWLIAMGVLMMLFAVLAVYLGLIWLPAVPLTLLAAGVVFAVMSLISRSQYLLLISQAICTEAASRQMQTSASEQSRRKRAIEQLAAMRADVRAAQADGQGREESSDAAVLFDLLTGNEPTPRIPRQEDAELYAEGETPEEAQEDEDLYPPKPQRTPGAPKRPAQEMAQETAPDAAPQTEHRRRKRSASLQLIRSEQAQ